jgi:lipopolysaccharide/colanic/teichoic acid biosynthesis glycosyltransferase
MTWHKRAFDVVLASLLLIVLSPVMAYVAYMIWRAQDGPIFYVAPRMKSPTQTFGLWKFRTMTVVDADSGVSGGDKRARITALGARLRIRRLDEFPQLWNILKGDMSFVGPRPPLPEYVLRFPNVYWRILKNRPGVTGLATVRFHKHEARLLARCRTAKETDVVYARNCVPRKARLDMIYQRHQSVTYDILLILETLTTLLPSMPLRGQSASVVRGNASPLSAVLTRP